MIAWPVDAKWPTLDGFVTVLARLLALFSAVALIGAGGFLIHRTLAYLVHRFHDAGPDLPASDYALVLIAGIALIACGLGVASYLYQKATSVRAYTVDPRGIRGVLAGIQILADHTKQQIEAAKKAAADTQARLKDAREAGARLAAANGPTEQQIRRDELAAKIDEADTLLTKLSGALGCVVETLQKE